MCSSAYRDGTTIEARVYAGLPNACHDARIVGIGDNPDVLEIFIEFTKTSGPCHDELVWTWENHCVIPYWGQQRVELVGTFEGQTFRMGSSIPDSKPAYEACGFVVIARAADHRPRLGCRSVLAGTEIPEGYEQVFPGRHAEPVSQAECEAWRRDNCM